MPKFGQMWFNGYYFGDDKPVYTNFKKSIKRIPLGFQIRKQFAHKIIFRVRPGNGYVGTVNGKFYQDKYKYFVPASINNPEGQPSRDAFKQAMYNWSHVLTDQEKAEYTRRANRGKRMPGWSLYIREYIKANL